MHELPTDSAGHVPPVSYARVDGLHLAYQVIGTGPFDLVVVPSWFSNVELLWESPSVARFLRRLASFSRVLLFDRRGCGLSDGVPADQLTVDNMVDDARAVMDAAGCYRAALFGCMQGVAVVIRLAAAFPERVNNLVLYNGAAHLLRAPDHAIGWPEGVWERNCRRTFETWGHSNLVGGRSSTAAQSLWWQRYQRLSMGPGDALASFLMLSRADVRTDLAAIRAPALVLHRLGNPIASIAHGRHLAAHIPDARLLELPGNDTGWTFDEQDPALDEIQEFLIGRREAIEPDRTIATIMFTDVVGSTAIAASAGDRRWRDEMEAHEEQVRAALLRHGGALVKGTGDGVLATFDRPSAAIRCGQAIIRDASRCGLRMRVGVHTGEIEQRAGDLAGLGVVIAARVAALTPAGAVLVTSTVRELVVGSSTRFESAGAHVLKGVPDQWELWRVLE